MAGWDFDSATPIYVQIVAELSRRVAFGTYSPGERLPSVRDLAAEAGVNPNTMQRALATLENEGLVHAERTSGRFVTTNEERLRALRRSLVDDCVSEFVGRMRAMGVGDSQIAGVVQDWLRGDGNGSR